MTSLSEHIARKLLKCGDPSDDGREWKCRRIEFRLSRREADTRDQERIGGGFCESALALAIQSILDEYVTSKAGVE